MDVRVLARRQTSWVLSGTCVLASKQYVKRAYVEVLVTASWYDVFGCVQMPTALRLATGWSTEDRGHDMPLSKQLLPMAEAEYTPT